MNFLYRHRVAFAFAAVFAAIVFAVGVCCFGLIATAAETGRLTVVLDAGHGGVDGGVVGVRSGVKESDLNLALTMQLKRLFEDAGLRVVLTRKTEAGLYGAASAGYKKRDMKKRAEVIRGSHPALVISVHQNFFSLPSRRGAQVFFREDLQSSKALACSVQASLNAMPECVKPTSPLKGDYFILNCSPFPSVIVECGFLSNEEDEALLLTEEYREKIAQAVLAGALQFLSQPASEWR